MIGVLVIAIQDFVIFLVLLKEGVLDSLLFIEISRLFILDIDFIVLVLDLSQLFKTNVCLLKDFRAFWVDKNHLFIILQIFPSFNVLVLILILELNRLDGIFRFFYKLNHSLSLNLWVKCSQRLMKKRLCVFWES